ncbi:MAG: ABC transporter permease, partial [Acetatifactor sp.]|nr:ABC transporter permease [Acetatifactor sp.]
MKKVLLKRFPRELKKNLFRYLSLYLLITFSLFVVFSIVDASERIMQGTEKNQERSKLEDGQVTVFTPFTDEQVRAIEEKGVTLEPHFHFELTMEDGSVLQVFENREKIDLFTLDEGRLASALNEVVLEKRYCSEKGLRVGDCVSLCGKSYQLVGIGSSVDYDAPYRKLADMVIDSSAFGTAFVTKESYEELKKSGSSEELTYAFLLGGMDSAELKQMIKDFPFDYDSVDDPYYQELLNDSYGKKDDLVDGINDLLDGAKELCDGAKELQDGAKDLQEGTVGLKDGA